MILQNLNQLSGGNTNVSPFIAEPNSCFVLSGCNVSHKLGAMLKDTGYTRVGDVASSSTPITGLFDWRPAGGSQQTLRTKNNDAGTNLLLQYNNAGTWTDIALGGAWDGFEDCKVEVENFIGYAFFVGYDATDDVFLPVGSLTGTTFSTATNVTNMPQGKYILRYRDRLYVLNCKIGATKYPYSVYQSEIPSGGTLTWTPNQLNVDYGEEITGGAVNWDTLMIFTDAKAYRYDGSTFLKVWDRGAYHRTIKNNGADMIFCDQTNVWMSRGGGRPSPIGGKFIDFIRNGTPSSFFAEMVDEEYNLYVGNVTVNGLSYTNCMGTFNFDTQTWRWRELHDEMSIFARKLLSGRQRLYMGASDGDVHNKAKYTDDTLVSADDGNDIASYFELAPIQIGNLKTRKGIKALRAYAERAQGLQLYGRVIDTQTRTTSEFKPIGQLTKYINSFDVDIDEGVLLQIAGSEESQLPYWSFFGIELDVEEVSKILKR
jgi:hypothetical protein